MAEAKPTKRKRGRPRKAKAPAEMTIDAMVSHNEYLERKAKKAKATKGSGYKIEYPKDYDGNLLAHTWVATIHNPCKWLAEFVELKGFTPKKNPWAMSPAEQQQAIARTLCLGNSLDQFGCAVSYQQDPKTLFTSCITVLYTTGLLNWWTVKLQYFRGAHFVPANGTVDDLHRYLATGDAGRNVILPVFYYGLPIGDNQEWRVEGE